MWPVLLAQALAFDVLRTDDLTAHLAAVQDRVGQPIVVAAAGRDTANVLQRLQRIDPRLTYSLVRVPLTGEVDEEMARVLESVEHPCGVRVSPGGVRGEWILAEYGACGSSGAGSSAVGWLGAGGDEPSEPAAAATGAASATVTPPAVVSGAAAAPVNPVASAGPLGLPAEEPEEAPPEAAVGPWDVLLLDHMVPDPTTALLSSAIVGFGAGHFYARDREGGWLHAGLQGGGLAVFGATWLLQRWTWTDAGQRVLGVTGGLGLALSFGDRLVDAATAPWAAHDEARRQIQRQLR